MQHFFYINVRKRRVFLLVLSLPILHCTLSDERHRTQSRDSSKTILQISCYISQSCSSIKNGRDRLISLAPKHALLVMIVYM